MREILSQSLKNKFVVFSGSPRKHGTTSRISEMLSSSLIERGHVVTSIDCASTINPCISCYRCMELEKCIHKDSLSIFHNDLLACRGIFIITPIYFFNMSSQTKAFMDRLFCVPLKNKIVCLITVSGSEGKDYGGYDIPHESIRRIARYCGMLYIKGENFVTNDEILEMTEPIQKRIFRILDRTERVMLHEAEGKKINKSR